MTEPEDIQRQPEQLDVVTPTGVHLRAAERSEVHNGGHWHQVFHCLVIRPGTPARVVLQRRHHSKAAFPGLLDLSATGHLMAGESPADGVRELNEELGIDATAADLHPVGVRLLADDGGEGQNRERVHLYFMTDDRPLDRYNPEPTEVESLVEVAADDLLDLIAGLNSAPTAAKPAHADSRSIAASEWRPGSAVTSSTITGADLIKPSDGYWTVLLVMAERYADGGGQPLAI
ncbi:MAG: NUDIX hydrolase [Acidimicrobiales bacterium]